MKEKKEVSPYKTGKNNPLLPKGGGRWGKLYRKGDRNIYALTKGKI